MVQQRRKTGKNKGSSLSIDDGQRHFLDEILAPAANQLAAGEKQTAELQNCRAVAVGSSQPKRSAPVLVEWGALICVSVL
jgi:hypothetical protein